MARTLLLALLLPPLLPPPSAAAGLRACLHSACAAEEPGACLRADAADLLAQLSAQDPLALAPGLELRRRRDRDRDQPQPQPGAASDTDAQLLAELASYASSRALVLDLPRLAGPGGALASARTWLPSIFQLPTLFQLPAILKPFTGKSTFLTGFGLGFLAFGLKKLLLPLFIGGQIIKSVLIAMFLPSILGGLGKLVGKGVSSFAAGSGSLSGPLSGSAGPGVDDFEFKDTGAAGYSDSDTAGSDAGYAGVFSYPDAPAYGSNGVIQPGAGAAAASRSPLAALGPGAMALYVPARAPAQAQAQAQSKVSYAPPMEHIYTRHKQQDFKVFQHIPASSMLLTHYDPFYSPLLSRLDSVFTQLGYESEACRERLVCAMYSNPARFAPYSNLVSAQLSRELNELRKPASDNPEILRFFRYMRAAKDGQDGLDCFGRHPGCVAGSGASAAPAAGAAPPPPMLQTYHHINKLVQARRLRSLRPA